MKAKQTTISPQDIVVLLKIITYNNQHWEQAPISDELYMSQSEISKSVARSKFSGLLDPSGKKVRRLALMELLQYGVAYVFPQQPGPMVRGIPTAHSAPPLSDVIVSNEPYVWPSAKGKARGQSITPLYPSVVDAVQKDEKLHELLALVDALRVGRAREKEIAIKELKSRILDEPYSQDERLLLI
ncbi:MAG: hypothetical protein Q8S41_02165 [Lutibacter sp.]|nr:hypothetical protein [Lutibacter sp.]